MGEIADALVAYAQPLIDATDGSLEQMNKALTLSTLCYNIGLLPEEEREQSLNEVRLNLDMDDAEFAKFRSSILLPLLERHREMFPRSNRKYSVASFSTSGSSEKLVSPDPYLGTDPYAPCPCNSGRKYKFCCRVKGR